MRVLFLDDDDRRHKEFKRAAVGAVMDRAYSAREAISLLRENAYDRVYLDHDLDDDPAVTIYLDPWSWNSKNRSSVP